MKFVRVLSRRSLLAMFTSVALIFSGGSVFADNVKVAAIYTLPVEQQWISRIHKALNSAKESGGVEYVYSENVSNTDPEVAQSHKLVSGDTELNIDMKTDGTGYSMVKTEDGTESKVNVPLGADFNMNEDASISILQTLSSGSQLSTNISSIGEVTVGVDSSGSGPNVKAPKGSEVIISDSGISEISQPATTDESTGISSQVTSKISPDGSAVIVGPNKGQGGFSYFLR